MAPQQTNNVWHLIQTVLIGGCLTVLTWIATRVEEFGKFRATTEQLDASQNQSISKLEGSVESHINSEAGRLMQQENRTSDHEKRIYFLEGILPDRSRMDKQTIR